MSDEEIWKVRGIYSQVASIQQSVVEILASRRLTDNRIRDLVRALGHLTEQVQALGNEDQA